MRLSDALADVTQLYIETAPFIYFVEQVPVYIERIRAIMRRVNAGNCEGYTSVITLAEVLPIRLKKNELEQRYREICQTARILPWLKLMLRLHLAPLICGRNIT